MSEKISENRVRRAAARQGLVLRKSRRRDPRALDFGTFALVDARTNALVAGDHNTGFGLSLDEAASVLSE